MVKYIEQEIFPSNNIIYLYLVYGINILFPIALLLYLIPIVGENGYGTIIYYQTLGSIILAITDFGYELKGIQFIASDKSEESKRSFISSIIIFKSIIAFLSLVILTLIDGVSLILIGSSWVFLYSIFIPNWYYIGTSQYSKLFYLTALSKIGCLPVIYFLIIDSDDIQLVPLTILVTTAAAALLSLKKLQISNSLYKVNLKDVVLEFFSTPKYSLPSLAMLMLKASPKIILGRFIGYESVTQYDIAEKFMNILKVPNQLYTKHIIQKVSKKFDFKYVRTKGYMSLLMNTLLIIIFNLLLFDLIGLLKLNVDDDGVKLIRLLSINVVFVLGTNIITQQIFLPQNRFNDFKNSNLVGISVFLILIILLLANNILSIISIGIIVIVSEILVVLSGILILYRQ